MNINRAIAIMKRELKDEYALSYLDSIEKSIDEDGIHGMAIQLKYVLVNAKKWTGKEATAVKKFVRAWVKEKLKEK